MQKTFKIAVLASTRGTTLQAIIDQLQANKMPGIELVLVANHKPSKALQRAQDQGYPTATFKDEQELAQLLQQNQIDLICLIGYLRILSPEFTKKFPNKIINVHPSLIPKFSGKSFYGKNVHEAVLASDETESGITIHYVDEGVDTGHIILQEACKIAPGETLHSLQQKIQNLEKKHCPEVIRRLANKSPAHNTPRSK